MIIKRGFRIKMEGERQSLIECFSGNRPRRKNELQRLLGAADRGDITANLVVERSEPGSVVGIGHGAALQPGAFLARFEPREGQRLRFVVLHVLEAHAGLVDFDRCHQRHIVIGRRGLSGASHNDSDRGRDRAGQISAGH
jgi:hypothetical protein